LDAIFLSKFESTHFSTLSKPDPIQMKTILYVKQSTQRPIQMLANLNLLKTINRFSISKNTNLVAGKSVKKLTGITTCGFK
jgi:hypothetical protein